MRDPEPCRIKHTEDTEQQTGCCLFFILYLLIVLMVIMFQVDLDLFVVIGKIFRAHIQIFK